MSEGSTGVIVADDHPLVLRGLADLIASEPDFHVVGTTRDGAEALAAIVAKKPELAILDLTMPPPGAIEILRRLAAIDQPVRTIILTASISPAQILEAVAAGVYAILLKESAPEELVNCMRSVMLGQRMIPTGLLDEPVRVAAAREPEPGGATGTLTPREGEIAWLVSDEFSNKEIARRLAISEGTVKIHLHNIYGKLQVNNRTRLAGLTRGQSES